MEAVSEGRVQDPSGVVRLIVIRRLLRRRRSKIAAVILFLIVAIAIVGPLLAPFGQNEQDLLARNESPSASHWLGTDSLGRDLLSLLLYATRVTVFAGLVAVVVSVVLGVPAGLLAGYLGGAWNLLPNTVSDVLLGVPPYMLALAIIGMQGPGLTNAMVAIGVVFAPRFFRVARGSVQATREETFIEASRSIGSSTPRTVLTHVLPNAASPILVQVTFALGQAIVAEAGLSFLGLGVESPASSLGTMLNLAFFNIDTASWPLYPPAVMIAVIVMVVSSLGDSMRDSLGSK